MSKYLLLASAVVAVGLAKPNDHAGNSHSNVNAGRGFALINTQQGPSHVQLQEEEDAPARSLDGIFGSAARELFGSKRHIQPVSPSAFDTFGDKHVGNSRSNVSGGRGYALVENQKAKEQLQRLIFEVEEEFEELAELFE